MGIEFCRGSKVKCRIKCRGSILKCWGFTVNFTAPPPKKKKIEGENFSWTLN